MTNEEYIRKRITRQELALLLIQVEDEDVYDEDIDGERRPCGKETYYITSDGQRYWEDYNGALQHECWWLAQNRP